MRVIGEVDDLTPYYAETAVNVVPLFTGGGIIVKTLNGLAAGRPTVATRLGNSGTGALPKQHLLIADASPESFANTVIQILLSTNLWQSLAVEGRKFVQDTYDWTSIINNLSYFLTNIVYQMEESPREKRISTK